MLRSCLDGQLCCKVVVSSALAIIPPCLGEGWCKIPWSRLNKAIDER